ncbi:MAG TPA: response regulator [Spirochaetota bacterium]|nr:response regulator [Spirochaetota bacterium]
MPVSKTEKVLIVEPNDDLRKTLVATLSEYFARDHIYVSENGVNALWQATDIFPDYVIMNYNKMNVQPDELLRRLKFSLRKFQGIILYASESEEYEKELRRKLSQGGEFEGIIAVNLDDLIDRVQRMFSERSREGRTGG